MATKDRAGSDNLTHLERLEKFPDKQHIFHAMRVLEAAFPKSPRIGLARRAHEDNVRFGQEAELSFAPSSIAAYQPPKAGKPARLTNRFFGLFGTQGPLPLHITEYARSRKRQHADNTFVAFADMITHRMMTLFFRAWRSGQPAPSFDRGSNGEIDHKVAAISGFHGINLRNADALPDLAKRHFSGLLAQGSKNAEGLVSIIASFFSAPVKIEQFVGSWLDLELDDMWVLGRPAALGQNTSLGNRVWTRGAKFRIVIGPIGREEYQRLLPGGASLERLRAIVRNYLGDVLDWDVNLILRCDEVTQARLGQTMQLGQTIWIGERKSKEDASDLFLEPNTYAGSMPNAGRN